MVSQWITLSPAYRDPRVIVVSLCLPRSHTIESTHVRYFKRLSRLEYVRLTCVLPIDPEDRLGTVCQIDMGAQVYRGEDGTLVSHSRVAGGIIW